jgi:hypothetical protein
LLLLLAHNAAVSLQRALTHGPATERYCQNLLFVVKTRGAVKKRQWQNSVERPSYRLPEASVIDKS